MPRRKSRIMHDVLAAARGRNVFPAGNKNRIVELFNEKADAAGVGRLTWLQDPRQVACRSMRREKFAQAHGRSNRSAQQRSPDED